VTAERAIELQERAWALQVEGKLSEAAACCRKAIDLMTQSEGPESADVANLLNDLAGIQIAQEDFRASLTTAEQALKIEKVSPELWTGQTLSAVRIRTLTLIGTTYRTLGEYARAETILREALALACADFGEHSEQAANACNELGMVCKYLGRFEEGIGLYERALKIFTKAQSCDSPQVGIICHNLGGILFTKGDFAAAESFGRRSWEISKNHWGKESVQAMNDAVAYAPILDGLHRYAESETIYRRALGIYETTLGTEHYEVAATLHNLAAVLATCDRHDEAEQLYRRALVIKERLLGRDNPDVALTRNNLGRLLSDAGRLSEAVPLLANAVGILEKSLLPGHPQLACAQQNLQDALAQLNPNS
jgi:tetratricopeptide (TPR) repeat protein